MRKEIVVVMFLIIFMHAVSAEIILGQPKSLYNFGDELDLEVIVQSSSPVSDFLSANIYCNNVSYNIYRNYFNLDSGEEEMVDINFLFGNSLSLKDQDSCYIKADFADEEIESQRFEVSRRISLGVSTAKRIFEPGEKISLTGTANKINGLGVNGFVDLEISPSGISLSSLVSEGEFSFNFTIPNEYSGEQQLNFIVYEKDNNNEVTNEGELSKEIILRPTLTEIKITLSDSDVEPGEEISYKAELIDQAGRVIEGDLAISIFKPDGYNFLQKIVDSGEENEFEAGLNYSVGYWRIDAVSGEITKEKLFYVKEKNSLLFKLINNTLIASNIGNVDFSGPIDVSIGSVNEVKQIKLDIGEFRRYKISAPDGNYQVGVSDGENEIAFGSVSLTGNSIKVGEVRRSLGLVGPNLAIWIFLIFIIALIVFLFISRRGMIKGLKFAKKTAPSENSSVISSGQKCEAGFLMLKVNSKLDKAGSETIGKVMEKAKEYNGGVNYDGDHRIMLFSQHLTKKQNNGLITLKVAKEVEELIKEHNKRNHVQINYGIGVNIGEIIAEKRDGKLKFVSSGNAMSSTKKIANDAKKEILVSDGVRKKAVGEAKFKRVENGLWKLESLSDREKHHEFLKGFIHRREEEKIKKKSKKD